MPQPCTAARVESKGSSQAGSTLQKESNRVIFPNKNHQRKRKRVQGKILQIYRKKAKEVCARSWESLGMCWDLLSKVFGLPVAKRAKGSKLYPTLYRKH